MKKNELLELIKDIAEDGDVLDLLKQQEEIKSLAKPLDFKNIGVEEFKELLASNPIVQAYNQSTHDSSVSKGVESYKANKLPLEIQKAVEEALKAENNKGKNPLEIRIAELEAREAEKDKALLKANLTNQYSQELATKGLSQFANFILNSDDEEVIKANIQAFETNLTPLVTSQVEAKIKGSSYVPPTGGQGGTITKEQFKAMGYKEKVKVFDESPELYADLMK